MRRGWVAALGLIVGASAAFACSTSEDDDDDDDTQRTDAGALADGGGTSEKDGSTVQQGSPDASSVASTDASTADGGDSGAASDGDVLTIVHLHGTLAGFDTRAITGRQLTVRGADGTVQMITTDASGGFDLAAVAAPYDLHIGGGTASSLLTTVDYLGLHAATLALVSPEAGTLTGTAYTLKQVAVPAMITCPKATCFMNATLVVAGEPSSLAEINDEFLSNGPQVFKNVSWFGTDPSPFTANLLLLNGASPYAFATTSGTITPSVDGGVIDMAPLTPTMVNQTVTQMVLDRTAIPGTAGAAFRFNASLVLDGTPLAVAHYGNLYPTPEINVPTVPNATLALAIVYNHSNELGNLGSSMASFAGPTSTASASFTLLAVPELSSPAANATLDATASFAWSGTPGSLYQLHVTQGTSQWIVVTGAPQIALAQLLPLDPSLPSGAWKVTAFTDAFAQGLDAFVAGGASLGAFAQESISPELDVVFAGPDGGAADGGT